MRIVSKIKVVVPISGGKDSQACLKLALEQYQADEVLGLFCDTQFEHPLTYRHIENMSAWYGVKIERVCAGSVEQQCLKTGVFPSSLLRFCTDALKIQPSKHFYSDLADKQGGFEVWYGMRSGESNDRAKRYKSVISADLYAPHTINKSYPHYLATKGVMFRLPILDWSTPEVFDYLGNEANPLYQSGFERVGCFPCLASGKSHQRQAFKFDETGKKHMKLVAELAERGVVVDKRDTNDDLFLGCSFCAI